MLTFLNVLLKTVDVSLSIISKLTTSNPGLIAVAFTPPASKKPRDVL